MSEKNNLLETPMTFGIEFETLLLQYYLTKDEIELYYDRQTLYQINKLKTTIEYIPQTQRKNGDCLYNIEIALGVYNIDSIKEFIFDKKYYIGEIQNDTDKLENFIDSNLDRLRSSLIASSIPQGSIKGGIFKDCALEHYADESDENVFIDYGKNRNILLSGIPQITLGLSYAFFIPILKSYIPYENAYKFHNIPRFFGLMQSFMETLDFSESSLDEKLVIQGFISTLLYYCYNFSLYVHTSVNPDYSYFKSMFAFKPRTNPAKSYEKLKEKYPLIEKYIRELYHNIEENFPEDMENLTQLYKLKNFIIKNILGKDIKTTMSPQKLYWTLIDNIQKGNIDCDVDSLLYNMMAIDLKYLIKSIFNPYKVIKINKINLEKIDKKCPIMEGYFYTMDMKNETDIISKDYLLDYRLISEGYAGIFLPPVLFIKDDGLLCTNERLEVFEWIPEDDNLITEARDVLSYLSDRDVNPHNLSSSIEEFFEKINSSIRDFLIENGLIEKRRKQKMTTGVSSSLLAPTNVSNVSSSLLKTSEPLEEHIPSRRREICNRITGSCNLMFRKDKRKSKKLRKRNYL